MKPQADPGDAIVAIRSELADYSFRNPGRVPPADSPGCPALSALWMAGHFALVKRWNLRNFKYAENKFGIVFLDGQPCVFEWKNKCVLVQAPASLAYLQILRELT